MHERAQNKMHRVPAGPMYFNCLSYSSIEKSHQYDSWTYHDLIEK